MQYAAERTHHTDGEAEREALRNSVRAANERADAAVSAALHLQVRQPPAPSLQPPASSPLQEASRLQPPAPCR